MLLEVVVEDAAGLEAAVTGGADRIELCSALAVGGLTPSASLMALAAKAAVPTRALCRPQAGGFLYGAVVLQQLITDVTTAVETGLEGVVIGLGGPDGLDEQGLARVVAAAREAGIRKGREVGLTLHRVFDLVTDKQAALEVAIALGFDTILTSGGELRAEDGAPLLRDLVAQAGGRIAILAGSGVNAAAVPALADAGITQFHASCRKPAPLEDLALVRFGFADAATKCTSSAEIAAVKAAIGNALSA